jgi:shikimate dehydrogenase
MQNAAFHATGLDWTYELLDVPPEGLERALNAVKAKDSAGANVTIPHKLTVMRHLDRLDPEALRAHAVNTLSRESDHLVGSNTDIAGITAATTELGFEARGATVIVLGAGGSARAVAVALEGAHLTFVARHPDRVGEMPGAVVAWGSAEWPSLARSADLLVNATPLGRRDEMPLRPNALPEKGAVLDLVYVSGGTPLVRKARSLGLRAVDGWTVLLAQGARSFEIWTGRPAPVDAMRAAMLAA